MRDAGLLDLSGRVAVVTGASRGIGRASAALLAANGASLVLMGQTNSEALQSVSAELGGITQVLPLACDSAEPTQITAAYRTIRSEFGRVDVLVNNAGVLEGGLLGMISEEMVDRLLGVNTKGPILHMQAASKLMRRQGGSIVNLSSIMGRFGDVGHTVYAASKAAVIGMTLAASKELAPWGIRVNAVAPGFIRTDMTAELPADRYAEREASIAMGRAGSPEDVARSVLFLASDLSSYVTGQVLGVDGGMLV